MTVMVAAGLASIGALFAVFGPWPGDSDRIVLRADDRDTVALGSAIYAAQCASCHGADLEGQDAWRIRDADGRLPAPPHDATGHTWHHDGETLFNLTKRGVGAMIGDPGYQSNMPAYDGTLTDDQIIAVLSYIKSTWPQDIRARHSEMETRK